MLENLTILAILSHRTDALFIIAFEQLIMGTDLGGWIHHARGMARLMEIRGPHRFKEYPEHG